MLNKKCLAQSFLQCVRSYSVSAKLIKEKLLIQQTTYDTDDWTNISGRFEPFVGADLYKKRNHPLRLAQEEIVSLLTKHNPELPIFKDLNPIEPNTSAAKDPNTFYVNRNLMLRTHTINRTIKLLKSHNDFVMVVDLYRKCQMDAIHFPAFHRVNFVRTFDSDAQRDKTHLKDEQQTTIIDLAKHLIGSDIKYRWTDVNSASTQPSWMFEIYHQNEWQRISSGGLIRNEIFEKSDRPNSIGWEIAINLDRLAMTLYNIFDIRQLWNASPNFLHQFEPKTIIPNKNQTTSNVKTIAENLATRPKIQVKPTFSPKKIQHEMRISYILPNDVDLETFPVDDLCKFIQKHTDGSAQEVIVSTVKFGIRLTAIVINEISFWLFLQVKLFETYFHPDLESYILNIAVVYKKGQQTSKCELKNIHDNVKAHAAHTFNLSLRT